MPAVTGSGLILIYDFLICKWESNGVKYCDTSATALNDCINIGYPGDNIISILDSLSALSVYKLTDQLMKIHYISSSCCNKY